MIESSRVWEAETGYMKHIVNRTASKEIQDTLSTRPDTQCARKPKHNSTYVLRAIAPSVP